VLTYEYQAISQTNDELYVTPINDQLGIESIETLYFEIKKNGEKISIVEG
jgi:membrane protease subunit (stomatin/prohibitin family)